MAKAEGIPPTASTASVGPNIRYVGDHAFGFAGQKDISSDPTDMFDFTTGTGYIIAKFYFTTDDATTDDYHIRIALNGLRVLGSRVATPHNVELYGFAPYSMLLPPETAVVVTVSRAAGSGSAGWNAYFHGRVYGAF